MHASIFYGQRNRWSADTQGPFSHGSPDNTIGNQLVVASKSYYAQVIRCPVAPGDINPLFVDAHVMAAMNVTMNFNPAIPVIVNVTGLGPRPIQNSKG